MDARVAVIVNNAAGSRKIGGSAEELAARFKAAGVDAEVRLANPTEIVAEIRHSLISNPDLVVVGGGDGTLNCAAALLVGTETALGVLPLGTFNHFARDLQIPMDLDGAVRTIAAGRTVNVDVGAVNDRFFLNNSSLGLYPMAVAGREAIQQRLRRGKLPAFIWASLAAFRRYPFLRVRIDIDGVKLARTTPFVFIGNNRYVMEGFKIGVRARLDEAVLSLYVANRTGRLGLLRLAIRALLKRLKQSNDFEMMLAQTFEVETRRRHVRVANDGELFSMKTPLHYRVLPAALSVVVPGHAAKPALR
jgi:YegS/Rv2252/BmrU family lipid kinase